MFTRNFSQPPPARGSKALGLLALAFIGLGAGASGQWLVPDAPFRAVVHAGKEGPSVPDNGYLIELPEFGQTMGNMGDLILTDAKGQYLPLAKVWRGEGFKVLLLAQALAPGQDYYVYFGGNKVRRDVPWQPRVSLLMETRRLPPGTKLDDFAAVEAAWKHATLTDGAGFVRGIDQGENPFGDSADFMSHFTGWLKTEGKKLTLYTLSSDASFVLVSDKLAFGWPGAHEAKANANSVPKKEVDTLPGGTHIDYYQVKAGETAPTMLLGWFQEKPQTIPPTGWQHPGQTDFKIEHAQAAPVPIVDVRIHSYMGWNGLYFYDVECSLRNSLPAGWTAEWVFDDGARQQGNKAERVIKGLAPRLVTAVISNGKAQLRGVGRIMFAGTIPLARTEQLAPMIKYLQLLDRDNPELLSADALRADFEFVNEFGTDQQIGRYAAAWMAKAQDVNDPIWISGKLAHLRALSQTNPQAAIAELRRLDSATRAKYGQQLGLAELDILVFALKDPSAVQIGNRIAFDYPNTDTARLAKIRVGDLYRLLGKTPLAIEQYRSVQKSGADETQGRKFAAEDRSDSITISDLIDQGYRHEAEQKVREWELAHPMAKYDSDLLLTRGRVLMLFGRWNEALQEIESFRQMQPDSPYQIPADFYRAKCLYELGKKDEARAIWKEIATKYPKHELAEQSRELANQK